MGTWGTGIFADDVAVDVRDDYRELLADGTAPLEATDRLLEDWADALADPETALVVWLALAATQARVGRLEDRVRKRALEIIEHGDDLARWRENPRALTGRRRALEVLRATLTGPQRAPTRIPRPIRSVWPWAAGSIVSFRRSDGRRLLLRVVGAFGEHGIRGGRVGILEVLDWTGTELPDQSTIRALSVRRPIDRTADSLMPIGVSVLNQRQLARWAVVLPGDGSGEFVPHNLITTDQLDGLVSRRYGL